MYTVEFNNTSCLSDINSPVRTDYCNIEKYKNINKSKKGLDGVSIPATNQQKAFDLIKPTAVVFCLQLMYNTAILE